MTESEEIKALASDLRDHLSWLQTEGFDTWKSERPSSVLPDNPPPLTLQGIRADLGDCQRCRLGATRKHLVFGVGDTQAELMFVGEGPGAECRRGCRGGTLCRKGGAIIDKNDRSHGAFA